MSRVRVVFLGEREKYHAYVGGPGMSERRVGAMSRNQNRTMRQCVSRFFASEERMNVHIYAANKKTLE